MLACTICNREYSVKRNLDRHLRTNTCNGDNYTLHYRITLLQNQIEQLSSISELPLQTVHTVHTVHTPTLQYTPLTRRPLKNSILGGYSKFLIDSLTNEKDSVKTYIIEYVKMALSNPDCSTEMTQSSRYTCSVCNREYNAKRNLDRHLRAGVCSPNSYSLHYNKQPVAQQHVLKLASTRGEYAALYKPDDDTPPQYKTLCKPKMLKWLKPYIVGIFVENARSFYPDGKPDFHIVQKLDRNIDDALNEYLDSLV